MPSCEMAMDMSIKSKLPLVFVQQVAAAVALACAVGGAHAAAAGGQAMDMRAAVQAAVAWHPAVRTAQRQLQGADEGVASARAGYYPQVKGGVGAQVNNRDVYPYTSRRVYDASVSVSQMLYDFGKVDSAVKQAEAGIELAQAQVYLSTDDVAREAAQAWVELRRQQAMVAIAKSQLEGVGALAELAWERQVKGASTRSDFMQAQSRRDGARGQLINYEAQARRWQARLMTLTGMQTPPTLSAGRGGMPDALPQACTAAQLLPTATVRRAQGQRALALAELKAADAQLMPTLSVDGSASRGLTAASRPAGYPDLDMRVMFNVSAPLFEGGRNQARQRAAGHALEAADAAVANAEFQARQSLRDAQDQSQGLGERQPVVDERIASIRITRDLYREQYLQLGTRSLLDLLNAEQEYHGARFEQVDNAHDLLRLAVECWYQSGRLADEFSLDTRLRDVSQGVMR
ncbi:type I secretion protein TolC [Comamonas testosteroni TK102]|uniref:Type I secretion protein TolC n=3 Tax=Comamonadaceae TaxID=80864 RepID=A0A076PRR7_COMTE|nr:type I secretion protein TolC [Comamonas testosteroni TK102]